METVKRIFSMVTVVGLLIGFILGMIGGYWLFRVRESSKNTVTSRVVVDRISNEGFLVTRSVFLDQKAETKVDKGSDWSNFWWGQTITANALTKVDVGVNLTQIREEDVTVDQKAKTVCIEVPNASVQDATIQGDITVKSKQGLLKLLLANNPNQDYNQAKAQVEMEARDAIESRPQLLQEAQDEAVALLARLFSQSEYTVSKCK